MTADAENFYLATPMERKEYLRIAIELIPQEFMDLYDLHDKVKNGYVYCEIVRGMYTPISDIPEGCVLFGLLIARFFIFSDRLLNILLAMYLVSNKVALN